MCLYLFAKSPISFTLSLKCLKDILSFSLGPAKSLSNEWQQAHFWKNKTLPESIYSGKVVISIKVSSSSLLSIIESVWFTLL